MMINNKAKAFNKDALTIYLCLYTVQKCPRWPKDGSEECFVIATYGLCSHIQLRGGCNLLFHWR